VKNKRDAAWRDYREESEQIIRAAIVRAEKTHNPSKGTQSTHAGYAVVEDLNAWVDTLNKEIPKDPPPEGTSRGGKRKTTESDEKDDPETYRADGTLRAHSATQGTIRLNEGVGQTDVFPSDADDRQTRSRSAGTEVEVPSSASDPAPQSSPDSAKGLPDDGGKVIERRPSVPAHRQIDPVLMSYSPPTRGGRVVPLDGSEAQSLAFVLLLGSPSPEVCERAANLIMKQEHELIKTRRQLKRVDEDVNLEMSRYIRRNAHRFGDKAVKDAQAIEQDIRRNRENPSRPPRRRKKGDRPK
jgi:hypothetical protein